MSTCPAGLQALMLLAASALPALASAAPQATTAMPELSLPLDCDSLPLCFRDGMALDAEQDHEVRRVLADARRQREALRAETFRRLRAILSSRQAGLLEARRAALLAGEARRLGRRAECLMQQEAAPAPR